MRTLAKFCSSHIRLLLRSPFAQEIGPELQITQLCQVISCYHVRERMTHGSRVTSDIVGSRNWTDFVVCQEDLVDRQKEDSFQ